MSNYETLRWAIAHDPCRAEHRSPLGAVPAGTPVRLLLWVGSDARGRVPAVELLVGEAHYTSEELLWSVRPMESCAEGFAATLDTPSAPGVLFYVFRLILTDGNYFYYAPRGDGRATAGRLSTPGLDGTFGERGWVPIHHPMRAEEPASGSLFGQLPGFQVTCYNPDFSTPEWMAGPVMYQIFPDRFARAQGKDTGAHVAYESCASLAAPTGPSTQAAPATQASCEGGVRAEGLAYHRAMGRPVKLHKDWREPVAWEDGPGYDPTDFYGGTLAGIREKLPYLASLGVEVLYLNPIFEARSNHRYDTADYEQVDPLLGTNGDFEQLVAEAYEQGIRVVLDAVLSHTGADSRYFNARGSYSEPGAAQGPGSPYRSWYDFEHPNGPAASYRCWWGDPSLPEVDENNPAWQRYIMGDERGVAEDGNPAVLPLWIGRGASGYRLDVADEIPDAILLRIRESVKRADPDAAVIGEVWEDATNKISYGTWRNFALGTSLDSVMNYPLRNGLLAFVLGTADAFQLASLLKMQQSNYPPQIYRGLMNLMSTHDVERQRTMLAFGGSIKHLSRANQIKLLAKLRPEQDEHAAHLQRLAAAVLYALPGMPCLYYGDERGMHGGGDPFCRGTFPWNDKLAWADSARKDVGCDLTAFYQELGQLRRGSAALKRGRFACAALNSDALALFRMLPSAMAAKEAASVTAESTTGAISAGAAPATTATTAGQAPVVAVFVNRADESAELAVDVCELFGPEAATWDLSFVWWSGPLSADSSAPQSVDLSGRPFAPQITNDAGLLRTTIPAQSVIYFA